MTFDPGPPFAPELEADQPPHLEGDDVISEGEGQRQAQALVRAVIAKDGDAAGAALDRDLGTLALTALALANTLVAVVRVSEEITFEGLFAVMAHVEERDFGRDADRIVEELRRELGDG